jgi:hypothetical protein
VDNLTCSKANFLVSSNICGAQGNAAVRKEVVRDLKVFEHAEQSGRSTTVQSRLPRWDGCLGMPSRFAGVAAFFWALVKRRFPQRSRIRVSAARSVSRSPLSRGSVFFESPSGTNQRFSVDLTMRSFLRGSTQWPGSEFLSSGEGSALSFAKNSAERHLGSVDACPALDLCSPSAVGVRRVPGRTERISRSARQKIERCNASVVSSQVSDDKTA